MSLPDMVAGARPRQFAKPDPADEVLTETGKAGEDVA
jgi:hypothetical protein